MFKNCRSQTTMFAHLLTRGMSQTIEKLSPKQKSARNGVKELILIAQD
jgi:hypothetical protein